MISDIEKTILVKIIQNFPTTAYRLARELDLPLSTAYYKASHMEKAGYIKRVKKLLAPTHKGLAYYALHKLGDGAYVKKISKKLWGVEVETEEVACLIDVPVIFGDLCRDVVYGWAAGFKIPTALMLQCLAKLGLAWEGEAHIFAVLNGVPSVYCRLNCDGVSCPLLRREIGGLLPGGGAPENLQVFSRKAPRGESMNRVIATRRSSGSIRKAL
ncbi:Sugar-specific transcriptional regulator TrmB [Pyrobaculum oguniense TE7]|uniref:Sugar-specific transcriptional regulator TrmB n=1 Tax=Pyrobaculum oguniense (strain DSM 13380 / JCM 10595 / TE7) TaxID=698757 RepID=H6Q8J9_PYROT|nr:Sugar-specific transcriptional regulator TrmB [Pyrobaculum oguniense TE7]